MQYVAWAIAVCARIGALGSIGRRRWLWALPWFSAYLLLDLLQSASTAYWGFWLRDNATATRWFEWLAIASAIARIGMCFEAFLWFVFSLPKFVRWGWSLMVAGLILGGAVAVPLELRAPSAHEMLDVLGAIERTTGVTLAIAMMIGLLAFEVIGGVARDARWHAAAVVLWTVADVVAWFLAGLRLWDAAGWMMIAAEVALPLLWVWKVRNAPSWIAPEPETTGPTVEETAEALRRSARSGL